jgi:glycosyltransferase involved in cell wall biosynthesis
MARSEKPVVAYLTAGGAGMFCGSCMRDNTLAAALAKLACDPWLIPLYTPIRTDEENVSVDRVFFGGVNVYLQQKFALFRWLPSFLDRWLDSPWLLKRVARGSASVDAKELGELTMSMLRGEHGKQAKEVRRLARWLKDAVKPKLVNLSNILIAGCAPTIKRELGVPVLVTLQGDDLFLGDLKDAYRDAAWTELRRLAQHVDGFIAFSDYYADMMAEALAVPRAKFHWAPMGVAAPPPGERLSESRPPRLGYFARHCPAKGFHMLVDAWIRLRSDPSAPPVQLWSAGWLGEGDRKFFDEQTAKIAAAGLADDYRCAGVVERAEKFDFLRNVDLLCVPTVYREPKGIFALEALSVGTPVVLPAHGAFPELASATGGCVLVPPNDPAALADCLRALLQDEPRRRALGASGQAAVTQRFTDTAMAERTLDIFRSHW